MLPTRSAEAIREELNQIHVRAQELQTQQRLVQERIDRETEDEQARTDSADNLRQATQNLRRYQRGLNQQNQNAPIPPMRTVNETTEAYNARQTDYVREETEWRRLREQWLSNMASTQREIKTLKEATDLLGPTSTQPSASAPITAEAIGSSVASAISQTQLRRETGFPRKHPELPGGTVDTTKVTTFIKSCKDFYRSDTTTTEAQKIDNMMKATTGNDIQYGSPTTFDQTIKAIRTSYFSANFPNIANDNLEKFKQKDHTPRLTTLAALSKIDDMMEMAEYDQSLIDHPRTQKGNINRLTYVKDIMAAINNTPLATWELTKKRILEATLVADGNFVTSHHQPSNQHQTTHVTRNTTRTGTSTTVPYQRTTNQQSRTQSQRQYNGPTCTHPQHVGYKHVWELCTLNKDSPNFNVSPKDAKFVRRLPAPNTKPTVNIKSGVVDDAEEAFETQDYDCEENLSSDAFYDYMLEEDEQD